MEQRTRHNCVYILKTGKNLYKIGKTHDLQRRLASYHTHLPILFRVVRQYPALNMAQLEESLHIVFQHKRIKGEWFQLTDQDLIICDNISRMFMEAPARRSVRTARIQQTKARRMAEVQYSNDPLLQVMEANEKFLRDYARVADDIKLGLSIKEIEELHEGAVSKATIQTVRRLLNYQTPNSNFLSEWFYIVNELEAGLSEDKILARYAGLVTRTTIRMVRRILRNQLY